MKLNTEFQLSSGWTNRSYKDAGHYEVFLCTSSPLFSPSSVNTKQSSCEDVVLGLETGFSIKSHVQFLIRYE